METEKQIIHIGVIGPESTGKSTLCGQLAAHYQTLWVREYAREYLKQNGTAYEFEDLQKIAIGQIRLKGEAVGVLSLQISNNRQQTSDIRQQISDNRQQTSDNRQQISDNRFQTTDNRQRLSGSIDNPQSGPNPQPATRNSQLGRNPQLAIRNSKLKADPTFLFHDTDLFVIKIWSEFVFNRCDNKILTAVAKGNCDLYLLCDIDLPWVADDLREYPDLAMREKLFHYYKEEMQEQHAPWVIISGDRDERLRRAVAAVDGFVYEG